MKKLYRVRKNEEFSKIIALKHSAANAFFVVYSSPKKEENARVGISVSKKLGKVREMTRAIVDFENCPKDLIIIVRKPYLNRAFSDNKNDLEIAIKKAII